MRAAKYEIKGKPRYTAPLRVKRWECPSCGRWTSGAREGGVLCRRCLRAAHELREGPWR